MNKIIACILETGKVSNIDIYLVGGSIRDFLLNRNIKDLDLIIKEDPGRFAEKIAKELQGSYFVLDQDRGIHRVKVKDGITIDLAKFQGEDILADLAKRDYTINAMAYPLESGWPIDESQLIDPYGGQQDIKEKVIRQISEKNFQQDPIRMLRGPRLMGQLDFEMDDETKKSIQRNCLLINEAPGERIATEIFTLLGEENTHEYLEFLDKELHVLDKIFPEIINMKDVGQCKYHVVDCWTHSLYTMRIAEMVIYHQGFFENHIREAYEVHTSKKVAGEHTRLQLIKLGALFHDIGKPSAQKVDETGRVRFRGHEITGAEIVKVYGEKLKLSVKEQQMLYRYIELHMGPLVLYKSNDVSGKALYKLFKEMGEETLDILLIAFADIVATRKLLDPEEEMGMFKIHIEYIANNYITRYKPIENISHIISGKEIMETLNLPEGILVGEIVEEVKKAIYFGKIPPEKERVLKYIKEIY
ncbi:polynucleotide adenylyltransferase/metal dependent phosphohydrolase [Alkaliphilus metalliredigens QYMF]|uniref:Polynucleotide adenylyltransferase/metal dependent phosphohydrolase n=1 Tax=Alkaliphilus metalliredigens (strain QYMF) TaxID=293826 RepID=A6TJG8_ALKMQ|nr:HDIG domain-containing metalloprotein [Alkaliphilus metalliredigens]ABR46336.1 polynucleotide adenylyltransferase/metal dependent phosphohydrolase [Alkaliphilus metalliredigens QYMF]